MATDEETKETIDRVLHQQFGSWIRKHGDEREHWAGRLFKYDAATTDSDPPVIILTLYSVWDYEEGVARRRDFLLTPGDASLLVADLQAQIRNAQDIEGRQAQP